MCKKIISFTLIICLMANGLLYARPENTRQQTLATKTSLRSKPLRESFRLKYLQATAEEPVPVYKRNYEEREIFSLRDNTGARITIHVYPLFGVKEQQYREITIVSEDRERTFGYVNIDRGKIKVQQTGTLTLDIDKLRKILGLPTLEVDKKLAIHADLIDTLEVIKQAFPEIWDFKEDKFGDTLAVIYREGDYFVSVALRDEKFVRGKLRMLVAEGIKHRGASLGEFCVRVIRALVDRCETEEELAALEHKIRDYIYDYYEYIKNKESLYNSYIAASGIKRQLERKRMLFGLNKKFLPAWDNVQQILKPAFFVMRGVNHAFVLFWKLLGLFPRWLKTRRVFIHHLNSPAGELIKWISDIETRPLVVRVIAKSIFYGFALGGAATIAALFGLIGYSGLLYVFLFGSVSGGIWGIVSHRLDIFPAETSQQKGLRNLAETFFWSALSLTFIFIAAYAVNSNVLFNLLTLSLELFIFRSLLQYSYTKQYMDNISEEYRSVLQYARDFILWLYTGVSVLLPVPWTEYVFKNLLAAGLHISQWWLWGTIIIGGIVLIYTAYHLGKRFFVREKRPEDIIERLKKNRNMNNELREFVRQFSAGSLLYQGQVLDGAAFTQLARRHRGKELMLVLHKELGMEMWLAWKVADISDRIIRYYGGIRPRMLQSMIVSEEVEKLVTRIVKGRLRRKRKKGTDQPDSLRECLATAAKGSQSLERFIAARFPLRNQRTVTECAKYIMDVYSRLPKPTEEDFLTALVEFDRGDAFIIPSLRKTAGREIRRLYGSGESWSGKEGILLRTVCRKLKLRKGENIIAAFDACLDVLGREKGLAWLRRAKNSREVEENETISRTLFIFLQGIQDDPLSYEPQTVQDAAQALRVWKTLHRQATYAEANTALLDIYVTYIRDTFPEARSWGWTRLWSEYYGRESGLSQALLDVYQKIQLEGAAQIDEYARERAVYYRLSAEETERLFTALPVEDFLLLARMLIPDLADSYGLVSTMDIEEKLIAGMQIPVDGRLPDKKLFRDLFCPLSEWYFVRDKQMVTAFNQSLNNYIIPLIVNKLTESGIIHTEQEAEALTAELQQFAAVLARVRLPESDRPLSVSIALPDIKKLFFDYVLLRIGDRKPLLDTHASRNKKLFNLIFWFINESVEDVGLEDALRCGLIQTDYRQKIADTARDVRDWVADRCQEGVLEPHSRRWLTQFEEELSQSGPQELLIILNEHQLTVGLLFWLQKKLKDNPELTVKILPQKSLWETNTNTYDINNILNMIRRRPPEKRGLNDLLHQLSTGRVEILDDMIPGLLWTNTPDAGRIGDLLQSTSLLLAVGWDNFLTFQGLRRDCYFMFAAGREDIAAVSDCRENELVFTKVCGGLPAHNPADYQLNRYLRVSGWKAYTELLAIFDGNETLLHMWVCQLAEEDNLSRLDVFRKRSLYQNSQKRFGELAFSSTNPFLRETSKQALVRNAESFGCSITSINEPDQEIELNGIRINAGDLIEEFGAITCIDAGEGRWILESATGEMLLLEILPAEDKKTYLRIGDKAYRVSDGAVINLAEVRLNPMLWVGNSELVRFCNFNLGAEEEETEDIDSLDVPTDVYRQIPQLRPQELFVEARDQLEAEHDYFTRLHWIVVLLASPDNEDVLLAIAEFRRFLDTAPDEVRALIMKKGLIRTVRWLEQGIPASTRDMLTMSTFTAAERQILEGVEGGHLVRTSIILLPEQVVSRSFFEEVQRQVEGLPLDVRLVRSDRAEGHGWFVKADGQNTPIAEGRLLPGLVETLPDEELMLSGVRLLRDDEEIIQIPENSSILNYVRILHHLMHMYQQRLSEHDKRNLTANEEFLPILEDALFIIYLQTACQELTDGFEDFKQEVQEESTETGLRKIFSKYGLKLPADADILTVRRELAERESLEDFLDYIRKHGYGRFRSLKELLRVVSDYLERTVNAYAEGFTETEQETLNRILTLNWQQTDEIMFLGETLAGIPLPLDRQAQLPDFTTRLKITRRFLRIIRQPRIQRLIAHIMEEKISYREKAQRLVDQINRELEVIIPDGERTTMRDEIHRIITGEWLVDFSEELNSRVKRLTDAGMDVPLSESELMPLVRVMSDGRTERPQEDEIEQLRDDLRDRVQIGGWQEIEQHIHDQGIKRVLCDIDRTVLDSLGFVTSTPWFGEMMKQKGLEETIKLWQLLEDQFMDSGLYHPIETIVPDVLRRLQESGVEIIFFTARGAEDEERTRRLLGSVGIDAAGMTIITSPGGTPELKKQGLEFYCQRHPEFWGNTPTLYIDDTVGNLNAVLADPKFRTLTGFWYTAPMEYEKIYEVEPTELLKRGDEALARGDLDEAVVWYYNAAYMLSRDDIVNRVLKVFVRKFGYSAFLEQSVNEYITARCAEYRQRLAAATPAEPAEPVEAVEEINWYTDIPDVDADGRFDGVDNVIIIGSHPHGDHVMGFVDYARRQMKNLFETSIEQLADYRTGGPITHSLSNYWFRLSEDTVVFFDLGWFPEGGVTPLIHALSPRFRNITFIVDQDTERTLDLKNKLQRRQLENVDLHIIPYGKTTGIPMVPGRMTLEIKNYPSYHLDPTVGASVYILKLKEGERTVHSAGYISELGDDFPDTITEEMLAEFASLDKIILDGTNFISSAGSEPLPRKGRKNKVHPFVRKLNRGQKNIVYLNTTMIRMGEEAALATKKLSDDVPVLLFGGIEGIKQLKRSYQVPDALDVLVASFGTPNEMIGAYFLQAVLENTPADRIIIARYIEQDNPLGLKEYLAGFFKRTPEKKITAIFEAAMATDNEQVQHLAELALYQIKLPHIYMNGNRVFFVSNVNDFLKSWREFENTPPLNRILEEMIIRFKNECKWKNSDAIEFIRQWIQSGTLTDEDREWLQERAKSEGWLGFSADDLNTIQAALDQPPAELDVSGDKVLKSVRDMEILTWLLRRQGGAVFISSGQFRGDPTRTRWRRMKGFQLLDAVVDQKDVSILIEGRKHLEGIEGTTFRALMGEEKILNSITGAKNVRAEVDHQHISGHITFSRLSDDVIEPIARKAIELGNVYVRQVYLPMIPGRYFTQVEEEDMHKLERQYGIKIRDAASLWDTATKITARWNTRAEVDINELHFLRRTIKSLPTLDQQTRKLLLASVEQAKKELQLEGRADIDIFIASSSKFGDVLERAPVDVSRLIWSRGIALAEGSLSRIFELKDLFRRFELGVSDTHGETVDLVGKKKKQYSRDIVKSLRRQFLIELYERRGRIPMDMGTYFTPKDPAEYGPDLANVRRSAERSAKYKKRELFGVWFGKMKDYLQAQLFRIGMRFVDMLDKTGALRQEHNEMRAHFIRTVFAFVVEDEEKKGNDPGTYALIAGGIQGAGSAIFKGTVPLMIAAGNKTSAEENKVQRKILARICGILNKIGLDIDNCGVQTVNTLRAELRAGKKHGFWFNQFLAGDEKLYRDFRKGLQRSLRKAHLKAQLLQRSEVFTEDVQLLEEERSFDVIEGPGGIMDILFIWTLYSCSKRRLPTGNINEVFTELADAEFITEEESETLASNLEFLLRYKEEAGMSAGGNLDTAKTYFHQIIENLGFATPADFKNEFYRRIMQNYTILLRVIDTLTQEHNFTELTGKLPQLQPALETDQAV